MLQKILKVAEQRRKGIDNGTRAMQGNGIK
jgi:hypothetical protein